MATVATLFSFNYDFVGTYSANSKFYILNSEFSPMLSMNDLKRGTLFMLEGAPFEVLEIAHTHMGRGGSSTNARIRNCITGQVLSRTFKQADSFEEADIEKKPILFLYSHRGEFVFCDPKDKSKRFPLSEEVIGEKKNWLKPNTEITAVILSDEDEERVISIILPIKMDLKVVEAPPGIKGDTAQGGTKPVVLETGATVAAPLFINQDDIIRVNTETGTYAERVTKA